MKKIYHFISISLFTINFYSQEGVTVSSSNISSNFPSGTYFKDINNELQYYVGTWQGVYNNTTIELKIDLYTKHLNENANGTYFYRDALQGRYKVTQGLPNSSPNPVVLFSSMHITDFSSMPLYNISSRNYNKIKFGYTDFENCWIEGELILVRNLSNPNELQYRFHISPSIIFPTPNCPFTNGIVPVPLPSTVLTLTKIN